MNSTVTIRVYDFNAPRGREICRMEAQQRPTTRTSRLPGIEAPMGGIRSTIASSGPSRLIRSGVAWCLTLVERCTLRRQNREHNEEFVADRVFHHDQRDVTLPSVDAPCSELLKTKNLVLLRHTNGTSIEMHPVLVRVRNGSRHQRDRGYGFVYSGMRAFLSAAR